MAAAIEARTTLGWFEGLVIFGFRGVGFRGFGGFGLKILQTKASFCHPAHAVIEHHRLARSVQVQPQLGWRLNHLNWDGACGKGGLMLSPFQRRGIMRLTIQDAGPHP